MENINECQSTVSGARIRQHDWTQSKVMGLEERRQAKELTGS